MGKPDEQGGGGRLVGTEQHHGDMEFDVGMDIAIDQHIDVMFVEYGA